MFYNKHSTPPQQVMERVDRFWLTFFLFLLLMLLLPIFLLLLILTANTFSDEFPLILSAQKAIQLVIRKNTHWRLFFMLNMEVICKHLYETLRVLIRIITFLQSQLISVPLSSISLLKKLQLSINLPLYFSPSYVR